MQILKKKTREKIIQCAKMDFYQYGYEKSSLRRIAEKAGMTVGNLYRYFKNKEMLFETIIGPAVNKIHHLIKDEHSTLENEISMKYDKLIALIIEQLTSIIMESRIEFIILIDKSSGSKYENAIELLYQNMTDHLMEDHFHTLFKGDELKEAKPLARAVTISFFQGIFEILRSNNNEMKIKKFIEDYLKIYFPGMGNIF
jgi:AcrR family transcriptional regulator